MNKTSSQACLENVRARFHALSEANKDPSGISKSLLEACTSQVTLAKFSSPKHGISPMSRNSMYKYADIELAGLMVPEGFAQAGKSGRFYLDWLRNEVKVKGRKNSQSRTKLSRERRHQDHVAELEATLHNIKENSIGVSKAYLSLLSCVKRLYQDDGLDDLTRHRLLHILHDHDRLFSNLFQEVGTIRPDNVEPIS